MKKKFIAGLVLVCLVLGVFAGCEKKEPILLTADNIEEVAQQMTDEYLYTYSFDVSRISPTKEGTSEVLLSKDYAEEDFINFQDMALYRDEIWMSGADNNTNQEVFDYVLSNMTVNGRPATRFYNFIQYKRIKTDDENDEDGTSLIDVGAMIVVNDKDEASIYPRANTINVVRSFIEVITSEDDLGENPVIKSGETLNKATLDKLDIKTATLKDWERMQLYKGIWLDTQYDFPEYLDLIINDTFYKNGKIVHVNPSPLCIQHLKIK